MDRDQFYRGLHLERHEAGCNLRPDSGRRLARWLVGRWDAQLAGGRVGLLGRTPTAWFATAGEAERVLRQKFRGERRRGYALQPEPGYGG